MQKMILVVQLAHRQVAYGRKSPAEDLEALGPIQLVCHLKTTVSRHSCDPFVARHEELRFIGSLYLPHSKYSSMGYEFYPYSERLSALSPDHIS